MVDEDIKLIGKDGIRRDGRKFDELRPITIEAGVLKRADGSAYLEWGENKVLAAVYGPREMHPRHAQNPSRAVVQARYNMAAFSVPDRKRPGPDRRSVEISKIMSEALEEIIFVEQFPRSSVDVFVEVLEASAGTRCAALTAASVALADAGIPMSDMISSCAAGKIDGQIVLDLGKKEDNFGEADVPLGMVTSSGKITLLQMDGNLTLDEYKKVMELAMNACREIYQIQREALKKRYSTSLEGYEDIEDTEEE